MRIEGIEKSVTARLGPLAKEEDVIEGPTVLSGGLRLKAQTTYDVLEFTTI